VVLLGFVLGTCSATCRSISVRSASTTIETLKHSPILLWGTRAVLLVALVVHVGFSIALASRNADARPDDYVKREPQVTSYAARTMSRWRRSSAPRLIVSSWRAA